MTLADTTSNFAESLPPGVLSIGAALNRDDIEVAERLTQMNDDSWVVHELINVWVDQNNSERRLRAAYAKAILVAFAVEVVFASTILFLIGIGQLIVPQWTANIFFAAVFAQVAAGVMSIIHYLFRPGNSESIITTILNIRANRRGEKR